VTKLRTRIDLTPEALAGYATGGDRGANPHMATSPCWYAFELGRQLAANCRAAPADVRMGRGDSIWTNGVRWTFRRMDGRRGIRFEKA
jgi:hypothetical protein